MEGESGTAMSLYRKIGPVEPCGLDVDKENKAGSSEVLQMAMQEKT